MRNWVDDDASPGGCTADADWRDVRLTCSRIGIGCSMLNLERDYWTRVFEPALATFASGATPNPDVTCNRDIKFGALLDRVDRLDPQLSPATLATGHYARTARCPHTGGMQLLRGVDATKDQSFFLSTVRRERLARVVFPLGGMTKAEVREIAKKSALLDHALARPESMGLCFVGNAPSRYRNHFSNLLAEYLAPAAEPVRIRAMPDDTVIGTYPSTTGIWSLTVGERSRFAQPGTRGKWYVCEKRPKENEIWICHGNDNPLLYKRGIVFRDLQGSPVGGDAMAQLHPREAAQPCTVEMTSASTGRAWFARPQRALTPGQTVVFYTGDVCLGGAVIVESFDGNEHARL